MDVSFQGAQFSTHHDHSIPEHELQDCLEIFFNKRDNTLQILYTRTRRTNQTIPFQPHDFRFDHIIDWDWSAAIEFNFLIFCFPLISSAWTSKVQTQWPSGLVAQLIDGLIHVYSEKRVLSMIKSRKDEQSQGNFRMSQRTFQCSILFYNAYKSNDKKVWACHCRAVTCGRPRSRFSVLPSTCIIVNWSIFRFALYLDVEQKVWVKRRKANSKR